MALQSSGVLALEPARHTYTVRLFASKNQANDTPFDDEVPMAVTAGRTSMRL